MERNFRINPVGLKGNEINERMKQLMGVTPINENLSRSTVELTKIGPDGKAYGIVRENHEYYIKVSDKTSNLTVEDFKYIGGLQNKKQEAYPSYAKATKHLNLKFNSICESYDIVNTFNVFVDDKLLSEHHPYKADQALSATKGMGDSQEYVVDKAGKALSADAKEEGGDNLADKKVMDEMEEVTLTEDELAIEAMLNESDEEELEESSQGEVGAYAFNKTKSKKNEEKEEDEEEDDEPFTGKYVSKRDIEEGASKDNPWAICTASVGREDKEKYEACVRDVKKEKNIKEELKGNQHKIDANKNGKIDGDDFKMLKKNKVKENFEGDNEEVSTDELIDRLDNMSAAELIELLGDAGKDVMRFAADKIRTGTKYMLNKMGHPVDEEMTIEEIQEAIADLKKKL